MFDVITIGAAVQDVYVQSDKFKVQPSKEHEEPDVCFILGDKIEIDRPFFSSGGGATNAAATFAHLGLKAGCIAKIGEDDAGRAVIRDLHTHGVHTDLLVMDPDSGTGYSTLLTTKNGQRTAVVYRGASSELHHRDIAWDKVRAKWIYMTSLAGNIKLAKKVVDFAAKHNMRVAWNPGSGDLKHGAKALKPILKRVDLISLNRQEASALTGVAMSDLRGIMRTLSKDVGRMLLLTDGKRGTYLCSQNHCFYAHPRDVPVVNATGAGDAMGSATVAGLMYFDDDMPMAVRLGSLNAESVIGEVGAKNGILDRLPGNRRLAEIRVEPYKTT